MATVKDPACPGRFLIKISLLLLLFFSLTVPPSPAQERTVLVGLHESKPDIFTSESGNPAGISVDIIEQIAKIEGWHLRYVPGSWAEGLECLQKGEIDLVADIVITDERKKIFDFNKVPVTTSWSQVFVRKRSGIVSIPDLKGKRIAAVARSVHEEGLIRLGKSFGLPITLMPVPDIKDAFAMVAQGQADGTVTYNRGGIVYKKEFGLEDTAIIFDPLTGHYAVAKDDPNRLLEAIDRHLAAMKDDPSSIYFATLKRWLPKENEFKWPVWLQALGAAAFVLLIISTVGGAILKQQVNARTRELRQINQEMEQRIIERTNELAAAMERA